MKRNLISFHFNETSLKNIYSSLQVSIDFNFEKHDIGTLIVPEENKWELHLKKHSTLLLRSLKTAEFKASIDSIRALEMQLNKQCKEGEEDECLVNLFKLNEYNSYLFSKKNPSPLNVYPLFSRWFTVSIVLYAKALRSHKTTCVECAKYWLRSKDYLDKSVSFIIYEERLNEKNKNSDGNLIKAIHDSNIFSNYRLLEILAGAITINDNSIIKSEGLLPADSFINEVLGRILHPK